jgi:serine/threonine protein kinase
MKLLNALLHKREAFVPLSKKKIHQGMEGIVYEVVIESPPKGVVCVSEPIPCVAPLVCKQYFHPQTNEREILEQLNVEGDKHHIIHLYGYTPNNKQILVEACDTDLFDWYDKNYGQMTPALFWSFVEQLVEAIRYCHKHHIAHTDIKLDNIGVSTRSDGSIHLCLLDFGHAIQADSYTTLRTKYLMGSVPYTAPEVILNEKLDIHHVYNIDYWELGVVLYCIMERSFPFIATTPQRTKTHQDESIRNNICAQDIAWTRKHDEGCKRFITELLCKDPSTRLNLDNTEDITSFLTQYKST